MAEQKSLWEVMDEAFHSQESLGFRGCLGYAAELRAIADDADAQFDDYAPAHKVITWLRSEAQRAERGEVDGQKRSGVE